MLAANAFERMALEENKSSDDAAAPTPPGAGPPRDILQRLPASCMPTKASGRSHGRDRRSRSPSPRERRRSRSRSRSEERTNERLRRERDEALSKLEVALSQLRDEAKDCDNVRKERDDARKERDDALSQLRLAQRSHTDDVRIQRPYLEQRVTEAANKLQPQWEWADTGESEWEAYPQHLADQLETALATGHTSSLVWRPPGASRGSVYEVDTRKVESDSVGSDLLFEKLNVRTETRRAVRRALVPIESNEDAISVERPPPIFLESYPSCWQGSSDIERVELPPTGPVGARLLEFMLSSMVQQSAAAMQGLEIRRIERVENHSLWENYQRYRYNVVKRLDALAPEHRPQALSSRHAVMQIMDAPATDPPSSSMHCSCDSVLSTHCNCGSVLPEELHSRVLCETTSEMWLWHGTKPSLVDTVCSFGLDPRKSNLHGLYGAGSYFADASSKSHQYSKHTDADGCRCMLLCRVTMGNPYMTDKVSENTHLLRHFIATDDDHFTKTGSA